MAAFLLTVLLPTAVALLALLNHAIAAQGQPLVRLTRLDEAPPLRLPTRTDRPLSDIRILDLTRILAGPICGRTLAAYGADVMLVNAPQLPNIAAISDTSRHSWDLLFTRGRLRSSLNGPQSRCCCSSLSQRACCPASFRHSS